MEETFKKIVWNIPIIGIIYLCLCIINIDFWFKDERKIPLLTGLLVQVSTVFYLKFLNFI
jgi:hypothetical protein